MSPCILSSGMELYLRTALLRYKWAPTYSYRQDWYMAMSVSQVYVSRTLRWRPSIASVGLPTIRATQTCRCGCRAVKCSCSCCSHLTLGTLPAARLFHNSSSVFPSSSFPLIPDRYKLSRPSILVTSSRSSSTTAKMAQEYKLKDIAALSEINPGDKIEAEVEGIPDGKVLLLNHDNKVRALSPRCTHYGAPLKNGVVAPDGRIMCPWHGGMFSTISISESPTQ